MIYRFDQFQLDIPRRELLRHGEPIAIRPKLFALLVLLVEQRDKVVNRETLFVQVWPGRVVSDATLSSCIKDLRKALDDSGNERRYIATVHGQGFRFIARVEETDETTVDPATAALESAECPPIKLNPTEPSPLELPRSQETQSAERKPVSALRCALLDADSSAESLGPELTHQLMQTLLANVRQSVERYGGQVTQWLSDGCLALFGAAVSHDDDARRAVHAAADLLQNCRATAKEYNVAFGCGVTSGVAVIGGIPGGPEQSYSASGLLLRNAERLCFAASDGEIIIDSATYELVRGEVRAQPFAVHPVQDDQTQDLLPAGSLGLADAWRVLYLPGTRAGVPRRFRRALTPLVGRDRELTLLKDRFDDACSGRGQCVALVGYAGIGKTRLIEEFRNSLATNVSTISIRCLPELNHQVDFLLQQCMLDLTTLNRNSEDSDVTSRLKILTQSVGINDPDTESLLRDLILRPPLPAASTSLDPKAQREIVENALIRLLFPVDGVRVLFVDDLHWLDASSEMWLGRLVQRMGNQRFLLLASYRNGTHPDWLRHSSVTQLPLAPISRSDSLKLLKALPMLDLDDTRQQSIVDSSGGNPFLLSELALQDTNGSDLPVTIQAVLSARIDELSVVDKHVLQCASVLGLRIDMPLMSAVCDIPLDTLREALDHLQGCELLDVEFDITEERLVFRHNLVQEAAYAMLLSEERQRLHQRVVNCFDTTFKNASVTQPEVVARHCEEAGYTERAARLWQRAASQASMRCAYVETATYVQHSLKLLSRVTTTVQCAERPNVHRPKEYAELELALMSSLGHAQMATHGYASEEVEHTWAKAEVLCNELGDDVCLYRVLIGLGNYYLASGEIAPVLLINRRLMRIARRENGTAMRIRALAAMGELMLHLGRIQSSIRYFQACLALVNNMDKTNFLGDSAAVLAHSHLAWARMHLENENAALLHSEKALATAHASDKPILLAMALGMNAKFHRFRDDAARATKFAGNAIEIADHQCFTYWHGSALVTLGWALARTGDTATGIATINNGIDKIHITGERLMHPLRLAALADAQCMHGLSESATATLNKAFELARQSGERFCLKELQRVQKTLSSNGQLLPSQSHVDNAQLHTQIRQP